MSTTAPIRAAAGPAADPASVAPAEQQGGMTHRQILSALSGMLLAMFVAFLSSTVVSNALPTIITDLRGSQSQYTWVVTATLLASTASTPIWGKLSDLFSKKLLIQIAIVVFIVGSMLAGLAQSVPQLIGWRVLQGLGLGGLQALVQIAMAAMISPRERGRYSGLLGGVMAVATVGGPLIGGVLVDTSWLGWRWCFYVGVPFAAAALVLLQRTLHLPVTKRDVSIDYLGAAFLTAGVSALLIWVTLAGDTFAWASLQTALFVGGGVLAIAAFLVTELRAKEPIVPLRLFRDRTTTLAIIASVAIGVAMFGSTVFLGQYLQISRGYSPTAAGLLTIPMVGGLLVSSTVSGILITRTGRWKRFLVAGSLLVAIGFALLATIDHATNMVLLGVFLAVLGIGIGMTMQNLVLAVQNTVAATDLGAASSAVAFFRSLGGTIGVSVLGAVLSSRVGTLIQSGLADVPGAAGAAGSGDIGLAQLSDAPAPIRALIQVSYGDATGRIFLISAALSVITIVAILLIREVALRTSSGDEQLRAATAQGSTAAVDGELAASAGRR
ncbi:MDR family MFS transporter [Modestobacter versicolor]|uniref:EmrB/QacA family drug resistance transporter n=1 Tax=Modestobacter versicolor TaxID=429133 RepID=A0A323VCV5_9ACTN|nr:MDR family MFS transporter [Modestobacter versicolor]MBB3677783.1 EmrB/QacA subfamily drug resistance transporter [Modestobacter versicolor]PZA22732.1 EmrB/QacA family drug resistance transporter [Modestobacter versicolor]